MSEEGRKRDRCLMWTIISCLGFFSTLFPKKTWLVLCSTPALEKTRTVRFPILPPPTHTQLNSIHQHSSVIGIISESFCKIQDGDQYSCNFTLSPALPFYVERRAPLDLWTPLVSRHRFWGSTNPLKACIRLFGVSSSNYQMEWILLGLVACFTMKSDSNMHNLWILGGEKMPILILGHCSRRFHGNDFTNKYSSNSND